MPKTGPEIFALLSLVSSGAVGWFLKKKAL
jgi:LPXTG-motif cell wall-anchored protein